MFDDPGDIAFIQTEPVMMKVMTTKNTRFAIVVDACGPPRVYTLWQEPKKDQRLQAQIRRARIMTIATLRRAGRSSVASVSSSAGRDLSRLPEILEALRGSADRGDQMGAGEKIGAPRLRAKRSQHRSERGRAPALFAPYHAARDRAAGQEKLKAARVLCLGRGWARFARSALSGRGRGGHNRVGG